MIELRCDARFACFPYLFGSRRNPVVSMAVAQGRLSRGRICGRNDYFRPVLAVNAVDACGDWDTPFRRSAIGQPVSAVSREAMMMPSMIPARFTAHGAL